MLDRLRIRGAMAAPLSILLADDDQYIRTLYAAMLRQCGHRVETAVDGFAALQAIQPRLRAFDLIITDHQMPNLSGIGLVRALRSTPYAGAVIVYSGMLSEDLMQRYQELGVTVMFRKPVSSTVLFDALASIPTTRANVHPATVTQFDSASGKFP